MARPIRYDLRYFPLDVDAFDDPKLLLIEEDYGVKGGYLAIRLMAMVYEKDGYFLKWEDQSEFTCAKRVGNGYTGALVRDVLNSCLKHGLFDKALFNKHRILSSRGIQKRWVEVMTMLRRKVVINAQYWVVYSEDTAVSSEEITTPAALSTVKESKVKETKKKKSLAPAKPPRGSTKGKTAEEPEPYWQKLVDTWFEFGIEKFKVCPSFKGQDPKIFKRIIQLLKKRAESKNIAWSEVSAPQRLCFFLNAAFDDEWLAKHFLLSNLENKFDQVIQRQSQAAGKSKPGSASHIITKVYEVQLSNSQKEINYLYEQWREDHSKVTIRSLETMQYDILQKAGRISFTDDRVSEIRQASIDYMEEKKLSLDEPTIGNYMKKFAILEFFKDQLNTDKETIFEIQTSIA